MESNQSPFIWIYMTFADLDLAKQVARVLLEDQLIACANINQGLISMYRWQGAIEEDNEVAMVAKTRRELFDQVTERVKQLHEYEVPCVIALPIQEGNPDFLLWLQRETTK